MITALKRLATTNRTYPGVHRSEGERALGWGGRARNPWEGGLAGVAGMGSKPEGSGCTGKVFVLREVTEINASTHG